MTINNFFINVFIKTTKNIKNNKWNELTREEAFKLERKCLTILNYKY